MKMFVRIAYIGLHFSNIQRTKNYKNLSFKNSSMSTLQSSKKSDLTYSTLTSFHMRNETKEVTYFIVPIHNRVLNVPQLVSPRQALLHPSHLSPEPQSLKSHLITPIKLSNVLQLCMPFTPKHPNPCQPNRSLL